MAEQKEDKSMKAGRVSQTVYRRSVLKQIQNNIEGIDFLRPSQEKPVMWQMKMKSGLRSQQMFR